jgi:hypothetical protein
VTAAKKKPAVATEPLAAVCVVPGCDQPVLHRGLCSGHWESPQGEPADT